MVNSPANAVTLATLDGRVKEFNIAKSIKTAYTFKVGNHGSITVQSRRLAGEATSVYERLTCPSVQSHRKKKPEYRRARFAAAVPRPDPLVRLPAPCLPE